MGTQVFFFSVGGTQVEKGWEPLIYRFAFHTIDLSDRNLFLKLFWYILRATNQQKKTVSLFETVKRASEDDKKIEALRFFVSLHFFALSPRKKDMGFCTEEKVMWEINREKYLLLTFEKKFFLTERLCGTKWSQFFFTFNTNSLNYCLLCKSNIFELPNKESKLE